MKKITTLFAVLISACMIFFLCACKGTESQEVTGEISSEQVKTVSFPEDMTFETLNDEVLKNEVYTLLDSIDPLRMDLYWSGYPRATLDDPESYEKIKALGTK